MGSPTLLPLYSDFWKYEKFEDGEAVLYDGYTGNTHWLNAASTAALTAISDGARQTEDVAARVSTSQHFRTFDSTELHGELSFVIDELIRHGLVEKN